MDVQIIKMTTDDINAVYDIEKNSFNNPWSFDDISNTVDDKYSETIKAFVAKDTDGNIFGFVILSAVADEAEIADIAVKNELRGHGIGKKLLNFAVKYAEENGVNEIFLEVRESNEVAKSLYKSIGFETIGLRRNYYRNPTEDAIVMKKSLFDKEVEQI